MGTISALLRPGNITRFEKMLQRLRAVGDTAHDLNGPRFEPQTSSSTERVTARRTSRGIMLSHYVLIILLYKLYIIMLVESQMNESPRQVTRFNCYTGGSIEKKQQQKQLTFREMKVEKSHVNVLG